MSDQTFVFDKTLLSNSPPEQEIIDQVIKYSHPYMNPDINLDGVEFFKNIEAIGVDTALVNELKDVTTDIPSSLLSKSLSINDLDESLESDMVNSMNEM